LELELELELELGIQFHISNLKFQISPAR
jgi:hypothetical protein